MKPETETREQLLAKCSLLCARTVESFGDLTPMEVEALLRFDWQPLSWAERFAAQQIANAFVASETKGAT